MAQKTDIWISLGLALFFWVPLLNIFLFLPLAIWLSARHCYRAKKYPENYDGLVPAGLICIFALNSFYFSVRVFMLTL